MSATEPGASRHPSSARRRDQGRDPERERLAEADEGAAAWRAWGPYLAERAWGTVREDYSPDGTAWDSFPHDHARSRTYRWNEDGMAGVCDLEQRWCLALALHNGRDPILKERMFGLAGPEGNHGEDVKECWWYLDATPTSSFLRWRYCCPQEPYPYADLVAENARRSKADPEYELVDTGIFDEGRYFVVTVTYAKASPFDLAMVIEVVNRGPETAGLDVLPTLWFRNTWSFGLPEGPPMPRIEAVAAGHGGPARLLAEHAEVGALTLVGEGTPTPLACDNETNAMRLWGVGGRSPYPKDGINDHVVAGMPTVRPDGTGTKAALRYRVELAPGASTTIRLRLFAGTAGPAVPLAGIDELVDTRRAEADAFYERLEPAGAGAAERDVLRQALAGMLWSKQWYHYDVEKWLTGDPAGPPPPDARQRGRNAAWSHLNCQDVLAMPDTWEYPWFAAWDLAFHTVSLALVDPAFAKRQLILLCREWYMHPSGQLPAYEWAFGDVNPPVHAWAAMRVFELDGSWDYEFLERVFQKLLLNFTWWVNRKDAAGSNLFEGGFLGLDNIGPFDRSAMPPGLGVLEQSDGTGWMAMYCLHMLHLALRLALHDRTYEDLATKFLEHFAYIATAASVRGLWDDADGFFYDLLKLPDGRALPLRVRSMVGLVPLCAVRGLDAEHLERLPEFTRRLEWFVAHKPRFAAVLDFDRAAHGSHRLLSLVRPDQLRRLLARVLSEEEFLSPHGLRSVSAFHREQPFVLQLDGITASVDYEPGESTSGLFGGNSNWRGPIWFPLNYLVIESLRDFGRFLGDAFTVECPVGSGVQVTLTEAADLLAGRLVGLFTPDESGRRPVDGNRHLCWEDPVFREGIPFHEYFHGDTGAGLGASHQTGWTGLVANLILERRRS